MEDTLVWVGRIVKTQGIQRPGQTFCLGRRGNRRLPRNRRFTSGQAGNPEDTGDGGRIPVPASGLPSGFKSSANQEAQEWVGGSLSLIGKTWRYPPG